jgi:DNA primase
MIGKDEIRQLKAAHRIEEVIAGCGVPLTRNGTRWKARCPFPDHEDRTPSFFVFPATQTYQCFGRCGRGGDVLDFLREWYGCSFREAVARLKGQPGNHSPGTAHTARHGADERHVTRHRTLALDGDEEDEQERMEDLFPVLSLASDLYHRTLLRHPEVLSYAYERGIEPASIERLQIGYADGRTLPTYLKAHAELSDAALLAGLISDEQHERLAGRLIFPERRGAFTRYLIGRLVPPHRSLYKYLGLPIPKPLFGFGEALDRLEKQESRRRGILLTEGPVDRVIALQWDLPVYPLSLVAAWASQGQLREILLLLERLEGGAAILLALDDDEAGHTATVGLLRELRQIGVPVTVVPRPQARGKDLGDWGIIPNGRGLYLACLRQALAIGERL